jgi:chromosome segregation ATPase
VPLDVPAGENALRLMADLADKERDLGRERAGLVAARAELERQAAELYDQRLVVAEQVEAVAVARQAWQSAECRTVAELEQLARVVYDREQAVDARGRELARAERAIREREAELVEFRAKLEGWQAALTAHEAALAATRDKAVAELASRRDQLRRWEGSLTELSRKWSNDRRREIDRHRAGLDELTEVRGRFSDQLAELTRARAAVAEQAAAVAARAVAVEQASAKFTGDHGPRAERRLRAARLRWERHFTAAAKDLDARRLSLAAELERLNDRWDDWVRVSADAAERERATKDAERRAEADRLARTRELDERAAALAVTLQQSQRTAGELLAVRAEVARLAAALIDRPPEALPVPEVLPEVVALQPV